jgi:hypothetical protein
MTSRYFESHDLPDRAASLFYKGGDIAKAVELCFQTQQFHMLDIIRTIFRKKTKLF